MAIGSQGFDSTQSTSVSAGPVSFSFVPAGIGVDSLRRMWLFSVFIRSTNATPVTCTGLTFSAQAINVVNTKAVEQTGTTDGVDGLAWSFTVFLVRTNDFPSGVFTANGTNKTASITLSASANAWAAYVEAIADSTTGVNGVDPDLTYTSAQMVSCLFKSQVAVGSANTFTFNPKTETITTGPNGWDRYGGQYWDRVLSGQVVTIGMSNRFPTTLLSSMSANWFQGVSFNPAGGNAAGTVNDVRLEGYLGSSNQAGSGPAATFTVSTFSEASQNFVAAAHIFVAWSDRMVDVGVSNRRSNRRLLGTVVSAAGNQLTAAIGTLAPKHWWKNNEQGTTTAAVAVSDTVVDYGSSATATLTWSGTSGVGAYHSNAGPAKRDSHGVLYNPTDLIPRVTGVSPALATSSTGTILACICRQVNVGYGTHKLLGLADSTTNQKNGISFDISPAHGGVQGKVGVTFYGAAAGSDFRVIQTSTAIMSATAVQKPLYDLLCVVQDGSGTPKIYLNGVLQTLGVAVTGGTPPAASTWFNSYTLSTAWFGGTDYNSGTGQQCIYSHIAIYDGVVLTAADQLALYALFNR